MPWALVLVSNACLLGLFALFGVYLQPEGAAEIAAETDWSLIALGLWPLGFFFRMAYSESLFLLVMLAAMLGMKRHWQPLWIALLVGLATACRPVGGALVPVFLLYLWKRTEGQLNRVADWLWRSALLGPVACWGLAAYMIYLQVEFNEPLAFAKTQERWHVRPTEPPLRHLQALLTGEPIWSCYVPGNEAYWAKYEPRPDPLFSLQFANPIFFVVTAGLVILGGWKGWLDRSELLLSAGLLLIPYVTHSYQTVMMGQGRYSASVFPLYIVLGQLLSRMPPPLAGLCCGFSAVYLVIYSALFAAWYRVF